MPQNNFIKQNLVLILGLALPVLLMVGFMLSTAIPNMMTPPPQYDMLFSVSTPNGNNQVPVDGTLRVKEGKLVATYRPRKKNTSGQYDYSDWRKLYIYEAKSQTVRALDFPVPDDADKMAGAETRPVASAAGMTISTDAQSPDGYTFSMGGYGGNGGFMGDLFWSGSHYRDPRLVKGNASVPLKLTPPDYYYYSDTSFIGWVTAHKE